MDSKESRHNIVVDVETTGLDPARHAILEVGAVAYDPEGIEVAVFGSVANPGKRLFDEADPMALETNGLTEKEILAAPPIEAVAEMFQGWARGFRSRLFFSFNREFDEGFLRGIPWKLADKWGPCIMKMTEEVMRVHRRWSKRPRLSEAAAFFGVPQGITHRAVPDAQVAGAILIAARKAIRTGKLPNPSVQAIKP